MSSLYYHFYLANSIDPIRIVSGRTVPHKSFKRIFKVREYRAGRWYLACFPEISGASLNKFEYIGKVKI